MGHVKRLLGYFNNISFHEFNKLDDGLSKQAIGHVGGVIAWEELSEGRVIDSSQMSLY